MYNITFKLEGVNGIIKAPKITLPGETEINESFNIIVDKKEFEEGNLRGTIFIYGNDELIDKVKMKIMAPGI